jgi:hypothetical protein
MAKMALDPPFRLLAKNWLLLSRDPRVVLLLFTQILGDKHQRTVV